MATNAPTLSTGRRKESVARVRLVPGTGSFELNGRPLEEYFTTRAHRMTVTAPLRLVGGVGGVGGVVTYRTSWIVHDSTMSAISSWCVSL